jgi:mono/diheme cytochrome c family protein
VGTGWVRLALLFLSGVTQAAIAAQDLVSRGRYLFNAGGCYACHTDTEQGGKPLAGGRRLETPFGVFYSPNITPDKDTGIGNWSDEDFLRTLHEGKGPGGAHYFPVFPYPAFTGITRKDALAIKAYLFSLDPIQRANREHELPWYLSWRGAVVVWNWLNFEPGSFEPDVSRDAEWNRGAYLTTSLGHCAECHSPRTWTGGLDRDRLYSGTAQGPDGELVPNITSDPETGIGKWDEDEIFYLLKYGELPDGDYVGGRMAEVVDYSTSKLKDEDLRAIVRYLRTLPPIHHELGAADNSP